VDPEIRNEEVNSDLEQNRRSQLIRFSDLEQRKKARMKRLMEIRARSFVKLWKRARDHW
jgi:hypothetical protein